MIATHYSPHCSQPWIAVDMDAAAKLLDGYDLTEEEKTNLPELMAGYCRLIDEAELCFYGDTEDEAVAACKANAPVRPWVGKLHHARKLCDDWGTIRDESGRLILKVMVPPSADIVGWEQYRRNNTDPTQPIVDAILAALNGPNAEVSQPETKPLTQENQ